MKYYHQGKDLHSHPTMLVDHTKENRGLPVDDLNKQQRDTNKQNQTSSIKIPYIYRGKAPIRDLQAQKTDLRMYL